MSRGRVSSPAGPSWLWVPVGVVLYVGGLAALRVLGGGEPLGWPTWTAVVTPLVVHPLLALALVGGRSPARLVSVAAGAVVAHAALVGLAPALAARLPVPAGVGAEDVVAWDSAALTGLAVVCVALLALPLGRLSRRRARTTRSGLAAAVRSAPRAQGQPPVRSAVEPARVLPRRAEPVPVLAAVAASTPVPAAIVPASRPEPAAIPAAPVEAPPAPRVTTRAGEPGADAAGPSRPCDPAPGPESLEEVVRIPFERVADQLPQDIFLLPRDRVAANLLEPGALLVPRRLVLPQLVEGAVKVPWSAVVDQFPRQALSCTDSEVVERLQDGVLDLPLDEVLGQMAPDLFALASPVADVSDLENFPPPFQPYVPPPRNGTARAAAPEPTEEPEAAPPAEEAVAPAAPAAHAIESPEELAGRLASLMGPLVITTRSAAGVTVQLFRAPGLDEDAVLEAATRIVPLIRDAPLAVPLRQVTLWGHEIAMVTTPLARDPSSPAALVTATPRGAAVGLLERVALHASTDMTSSRPGGGLDLTGTPATASLLEVSCPPEVRALVGHLGGPGAVAPLVLRDQEGRLVYAFLSRGMPARALATLSARLDRALDGAVVQVDTVALRVAACRVLSRRIGGQNGTRPLLVLGSVSVDRPGLARLELDRIAARLAAVVGG